ncbi:MAG: hypothetical protein ACREP2_09360 [Rhodanobacteraceae bacterium]
MYSKLVITAAIAAALGFASLQASAAQTDPGEHAEAMATRSAKITPTRAVTIAERGGGTAYGFGMESQGSGHWYEVDMLRHGHPMVVRIDSNSGHVLGSSPARGDDKAGAHALDHANLKLGPAIATAERAAHNPAMEANATGSGASAAVIVDISAPRGIQHYKVTGQGGQLHATRIAHDPTGG